MDTPFSQSSYRCRLEWGPRGARMAAERGDILVIVDTLCFSTCVATAAYQGAAIRPCAKSDDVSRLAVIGQAEAAVAREDVPGKGQFSLSPLTYLGIAPGARIVLPSPNGATCARHAGKAAHLFVGALVNARAVAEAIRDLLDLSDLCVTVIACGERWTDISEEGDLRFAIEDYLGSGAILSNLLFEKSPEADLCAESFLAVRQRLEKVLWDSASGRELRDRGYEGDVRHAARLDEYGVAPTMREEWLEALS